MKVSRSVKVLVWCVEINRKIFVMLALPAMYWILWKENARINVNKGFTMMIRRKNAWDVGMIVRSVKARKMYVRSVLNIIWRIYYFKILVY